MAASSFRSLEEIAVKGMNLIPEKPSLKYYQEGTDLPFFLPALRNSMIKVIYHIYYCNRIYQLHDWIRFLQDLK